MSNTSPYAVVSTQMKCDKVNSIISMKLRGLHISTVDILLAAFFDTSTRIFKIATINFSTSLISFKETLPAMTNYFMSRVIFLTDALYFALTYGDTINTNSVPNL